MKKLIATLNHTPGFFLANIILLFALANIFVSSLDWRIDMSRDQVNSLSSSSDRVLSRLQDRVLVEAYISQDMPGQVLSLLQPVLQQLREIERIGGSNIQYRLINPDSKSKKEEAAKRNIRGVPIEQQKPGQSTVKMAYFSIYLQSGDKSTVISLLETDASRRQQGDVIIPDFEFRFLREVKNLTRKSSDSGIAFAQARGLFQNVQPGRRTGFSKDSMYLFRFILQKEKGTIRQISLQDPIPDTIRVMILAGAPLLSETEIYQLDQYLMRGGAIVCLFNGFRFTITPPRRGFRGMRAGGGSGRALVEEKATAKINEWLGRYGVLINPDIIYEYELQTPTYDFFNQYLLPHNNPAWAYYDRRSGNLTEQYPGIKGVNLVVFPWFSTLDLREATQPDVRFRVLIRTSGRAMRRRSANFDVRSLHSMERGTGETAVPSPRPTAVIAEGTFRSSFAGRKMPAGLDTSNFIARSESGSIGRLAVIGTPYLVSDIMLQRSENGQAYRYNSIFLTNLLEAMTGDEDLLAARSRTRNPSRLDRTGPIFETIFQWFHILFIPILLGIYGLRRLSQRNRKRGLEHALEPGETVNEQEKGI